MKKWASAKDARRAGSLPSKGSMNGSRRVFNPGERTYSYNCVLYKHKDCRGTRIEAGKPALCSCPCHTANPKVRESLIPPPAPIPKPIEELLNDEEIR